MKIILVYFILSIVITFGILYLINPDPQVVVKYPNINDKKSDLYVDDNNICYRYKTTEIKCA
jgi:hypothetical protein